MIVAGNEDGGPLGVRHEDRFANRSKAQAIRFLEAIAASEMRSSKSVPSSDSPLPIPANVPIDSSRTAVLRTPFDAYSGGSTRERIEAMHYLHVAESWRIDGGTGWQRRYRRSNSEPAWRVGAETASGVLVSRTTSTGSMIVVSMGVLRDPLPHLGGGKGRRFEAMGIDTHVRAMLFARAQLVTQKVKLTNCIDARHEGRAVASNHR